jgi:MFS family permease
VAGLASPAFVLLVTATFAVFAAVGAIIPVLPRYVTGPLGGGGAGVGLVVGAFFVAALCSRPLAGRLGDERGRRLVIAGGAAVMAVSVAAFPLAPNVAVLAVLRLVQGAGEAAFYVGVASAVTDLVPAARRGEAISYFSAALYGGLALGPLMGEAVLSHGGYGWVWTTAALLAAVAAAAGVVLREAPRSWPAPTEARARLLHPAALVPGSAFGLATFGYAAFAAFMPLYARTLGLSGSGAVFGCYAGITLAGRLLGARLPDRLGAARTARAGMVLMAAGMAVLGTWRSPAGLWAGTVVFAAGNAFLFPALLSLTLAAAPERERGAVVGTVIAFFDIGQGAGALLLGPLAAAAGYPVLFLTGALAGVAGLAVLSAYLRRAPRPVTGDWATAA